MAACASARSAIVTRAALQALGQLVAHALELAEIEQPRLAGAVPAGAVEAAHLGERGHERVRQLALEPGDLRRAASAARPARPSSYADTGGDLRR